MEQSVKETSQENCDCGLNTGQAVENVLMQNMECPRGDTYRTRIDHLCGCSSFFVTVHWSAWAWDAYFYAPSA